MPEVKLIISSRSNLSLLEIDHVKFPIVASQRDLRLYLDSIVTDIVDEIAADLTKPNPDELKRNIIDRIIGGSNGMFLLESLHVRQLRSAASLREIIQLSHSVPRGRCSVLDVL